MANFALYSLGLNLDKKTLLAKLKNETVCWRREGKNTNKNVRNGLTEDISESHMMVNTEDNERLFTMSIRFSECVCVSRSTVT